MLDGKRYEGKSRKVHDDHVLTAESSFPSDLGVAFGRAVALQVSQGSDVCLFS